MKEENKVLAKAGTEIVLVPTVYKIISNVTGELPTTAPVNNKIGQILETVAKVAITACVVDFTSTYVVNKLELVMKSLASKG